jgi:hypothetical protein
MFAITDSRCGSFERRRRSLRGVGLAALAAGLVAAAPATDAAVPGGAAALTHSAGSGAGGDENLLAGSPRISTVRALVPRRGRHAGRLIVWARVDHAPGTPRALARELPETIHSGRVVARVGKRSRFATHRLDLHRSPVAHGYFLRFPRRATQALAAGSGRVPVSLRVAQTVDLNSDGDHEDRALATTTRNVPLARPAVSIEAKDGYYSSTLPQTYDHMQVYKGAVTQYGFVSGAHGPCGIGPGDILPKSAPVDPTNGTFSFSDTFSIGPGNPTSTTDVKGHFVVLKGQQYAEVIVLDTANISAQTNSGPCTEQYHNGFAWLLP